MIPCAPQSRLWYARKMCIRDSSNTEELLPVISFNAKTSTDEQKKHDDFVDRMMEKGYTRKQVRLLCEWYLRVRKSS